VLRVQRTERVLADAEQIHRLLAAARTAPLTGSGEVTAGRAEELVTEVCRPTQKSCWPACVTAGGAWAACCRPSRSSATVPPTGDECSAIVSFLWRTFQR
jgi:hypothetical protein